MADQSRGGKSPEDPERREPERHDPERVGEEQVASVPDGAVPDGAETEDAENGDRASQGAEPDFSHEELVDVGPVEEEPGDLLTEDDLDILSGQTTAEQLAAERLADLQRVTAEYANYRKRTEANREADRERAIGDAVQGLLPVLDDLERAEQHGDLVEGSAFATIATKLRATVERLGLIPFGETGEPFDPQIHEAISQQPAADIAADTVAAVVETGYRLGSTTVRVAKVVVSVPA